MSLPIFIDIDGTLTMTGGEPWGEPCPERLQRVRDLVAAGEEVVIWSGGGTAYARAFADKHGLEVMAVVGKPGLMVDDNPNLRPEQRLQTVLPEDFFHDC
ncbi:hypothetical protein LCGC14_2333370 [marine sediment metagenome]|uniref:FCP1 homology domain-containing protein n=1 Tax=marine sediment metagenome TaxID=412755 RepID=A0A0F9CF04_9ZZZZ